MGLVLVCAGRVIGGLALDFLSPLPIGTHLLALLLVVVVVAAISDILPRENRLVVIVNRAAGGAAVWPHAGGGDELSPAGRSSGSAIR